MSNKKPKFQVGDEVDIYCGCQCRITEVHEQWSTKWGFTYSAVLLNNGCSGADRPGSETSFGEIGNNPEFTKDYLVRRQFQTDLEDIFNE